MRRLLGCCLLLVGLFSSGSLRAARTGTVEGPQPGQQLHAGQLFTVRWQRLPLDTSECELLLYLGGQQRPLRLTRELDGTVTSFSWRVPNIPVKGARLVLRAEIDDTEVEVTESAPFEIVTEPSGSLETVAMRRGELWLTTNEGLAAPLERTMRTRETLESALADDGDPADVPTSRDTVAALALAPHPRDAEAPLAFAEAARGFALASSPLTVPMRN